MACVDRSQSSPRYHQKKITHLTLQRNNYARDQLSRTSLLFVALTAFGGCLLQRLEEIALLMFASLFEVNNKQVDVLERCQLISFSFMMRICWFEPDSSWLGTLNLSNSEGAVHKLCHHFWRVSRAPLLPLVIISSYNYPLPHFVCVNLEMKYFATKHYIMGHWWLSFQFRCSFRIKVWYNL